MKGRMTMRVAAGAAAAAKIPVDLRGA